MKGLKVSDLDKMKELFNSLSIDYKIETNYLNADFLNVEKHYTITEYEFTKEGKFKSFVGHSI
jgi:hypothetical protein